MESYQTEGYRFVTDSWDDAKYDALDAVGKLTYRSNILGDDQRITACGVGSNGPVPALPVVLLLAQRLVQVI